MISAEARFAAGLLSSRLQSLLQGDDAALTEALRDVLTSSTMWEQMGNNRHPVIDGRGLSYWSGGEEVKEADDARLASAWNAVVPPLREEAFIRVQVATARESAELKSLGQVTGRRVVGVLSSYGPRFEWQWPLRVGVVPGRRAAGWLDELRATTYYGQLFEARLVARGGEEQFEVVIVDVEDMPKLDDPVVTAARLASCVIGVGIGDPETSLRKVRETFAPIIAIAMPVDDVSWWRTFFHEMSHDFPVDVAAVAANENALVAGLDEVIDLTAVGHWAVRAGEDSNFPDLAMHIDSLDFRHEDGAASVLTERAVQHRAQGNDLAVRRRMAMAGPPDQAEEEAPIEEVHGPPLRRSLIAEFWLDEVAQRKVLPPLTDITLELKIAVPADGEIAADQPFNEPDVHGPAAMLDVVVRSSLWQGGQRQQISLPMEHRDRSSSSAAFDFTTGPEGTVAEFDIVVLFQNRPLQAATLTAAVRSKSLPRERVTLLVHQQSSPSEPTEQLSPSDVSLDTRGDELVNRATGKESAVGDTQAILDAIEAVASQTLGIDDAPDDFDDKRAVALLIDLARKGSRLRAGLDDLDLTLARSIDLHVKATTRIFPLELVYEGMPPKAGALICEHHRNAPPPAGETCGHTSTRRVCPYAFWGMYRRVTRTVQFENPLPGEHTHELRINDVLYAAAKQADAGSPPNARPTELLATAAQQLVGTSQAAPVTSWTAWSKQVDLRQPALLVVLGHTQRELDETSILIGKTSSLATTDITARMVRKPASPAPIVVLMACASGQDADAFGTMAGAFMARGAGAVVATLTKLAGRHGAVASQEIMRALVDAGPVNGSVGDAVWSARRALVAQEKVLGLLLVNHGDVDTKVVA